MLIPTAAVCVVIVSYRYPHHLLSELLATVAHQAAGHVVLVDNDPAPDCAQLQKLSAQYPCCQMIVNRANLGLAKALNQGIDVALQAGFDQVLLLDQDSRPEPDMLSHLLTARHRLATTAAAPIAAVGASIVDQRLGQTLPFVRYGRVREIKYTAVADTPAATIESDMLFTSGSLLDAQALREVGPMDERLFIHNIDFDWCFRARAAGFRLFGITDAVLRHELGDRLQQVPLLNKQIVVHDRPERHYYIVRNHLLLFWRRHVPLGWKIHYAARVSYRLVYFSLFVTSRWTNFIMMSRGLRDGVLGRTPIIDDRTE